MKLSRKIIASLSAAALAFAMLGMVGCSTEEETVETELTTADINAQDIEILETGYEVIDQSLCFAFTVKNPNAGYIANGVTFTVDGYNEEGSMVTGGGATLQMIYPDIETACAGTTSFDPEAGNIVRFEVHPLMENVTWTKTDVTPEEFANRFELSNVQVSEIDGQTIVNGSVSADLGVSLESDDADALANAREDVHVVVLFRDADGKLLCGGSSLGVILDPSMTSVIGTPINPDETMAEGSEADDGTLLDENGEPVASDPAAAEVDEPVPAEVAPSTVATTTFYIPMPGIVNYASYQIIVTPGM